MKAAILNAALSLALLTPTVSYAFGPEGHKLVGAIADEQLDGKPVAKKVRHLLGGLSLERAATLADEIKAKDKDKSFKVEGNEAIEKEFLEFWKANCDPEKKPSHHNFHYTDIPLEEQKYEAGGVGQGKADIVHMIPYCIEVIRGNLPADNDRKITPRVAVALLAHYVGDIHQPLHVGAQYFDKDGKPINPKSVGEYYENQGGNLLLITVGDKTDHGRDRAPIGLHSLWDSTFVSDAKKNWTKELDLKPEIDEDGRANWTKVRYEIVEHLGSKEPEGWRMDNNTDVLSWAEAWANEALPLARKAHEKFEWKLVNTENHNGQREATIAVRIPDDPDASKYRAWGAGVVQKQIHKAGWRLAALLEVIVQ